MLVNWILDIIINLQSSISTLTIHQSIKSVQIHVQLVNSCVKFHLPVHIICKYYNIQ